MEYKIVATVLQQLLGVMVPVWFISLNRFVEEEKKKLRTIKHGTKRKPNA